LSLWPLVVLAVALFALEYMYMYICTAWILGICTGDNGCLKWEGPFYDGISNNLLVESLSQSYGASLAVWDHTVLTATRRG